MEAVTSQSMRHFHLGEDGKKLSIRDREGAFYHAIKEHIGLPEFSRSLLFTKILFCRT